MKLEQMVKTALDELRMQMLGAQVLFGFQFQSLFQTGFDDVSETKRYVLAVAMGLMALTLGVLISAPSQHRIVESGRTTWRIHRVATRCAEIALLPFALSIACDFFVITSRQFGDEAATVAAASALVAALLGWYGLEFGLRARFKNEEMPMSRVAKISHSDLDARIEHMLTEARVILPGAQALLGFQLVVTMTRTFDELPFEVRVIHFGALACVSIAVILLIAPAAVHRITFQGRASERFHRIGSILVTIALVPLAAGLASDLYVAVEKMFPRSSVAPIGAVMMLGLLLILWYVLPWTIRKNIETY